MEDNQRFDACMKQVEVFSKKVYNRQSYQWKITLGLWALIAASVNFLWGKRIAVPWYVFPLVLFGYSFLWARAVAVKNYDDQKREWYFIRQGWDILSLKDVLSAKHSNEPPTTLSWKGPFAFLWHWPHGFECVTTAALLGAAYWLLRCSHAATP